MAVVFSGLEWGLDLLTIEKAYLDYLVQTKKASKQTVSTYRSVYRMTWRITRELGVELDADALDEVWADYLIEAFRDLEGLSPATIHRNVGAVRGLLRFARQRRWTKNDPLLDVELPAKEQLDRVELGMGQLNAVEQAAALLPKRAHRVMARTLFLVQFAIGTRVSELLSLQPDDIDFHAGVVKIRKGKGGKRREVPIGPRAVEALREWLQVRCAWLETREGDQRVRGEEPPYLWLADRGRRLSPAGLSRIYDELGRLAGLDIKFRTHDLRAMTAQHWKRSGVEMDDIQVWLGHADARTTKIYTQDAVQDTRRWAPFCDLPTAELDVPTPSQVDLAEPSVAGEPRLGMSDAVGMPQASGSLLEALQALQALETLQQQYPMLQQLLAGVLPSGAATPVPQGGVTAQVLATLLGVQPLVLQGSCP